MGGQGRGGRVCDEVRALGSGHLMEVCVYVCGGGSSFAVVGSLDFIPNFMRNDCRI